MAMRDSLVVRCRRSNYGESDHKELLHEIDESHGVGSGLCLGVRN
jgi:hypothetical protein